MGWRRPCFGEPPLARFREKQAEEGRSSSQKQTWEKVGFCSRGGTKREVYHSFAGVFFILAFGDFGDDFFLKLFGDFGMIFGCFFFLNFWGILG